MGVKLLTKKIQFLLIYLISTVKFFYKSLFQTLKHNKI